MPGVVATEWLTVLFGVLLVIAPWVLTYTDRVGASWTSWAVGIIAVALGGSAVPASNQAARQRRYPTAGIPARSYGLSALARSDRSSASATRAAGTRTSAPHRPRAARRGRARRRPWPSGPSREGRWGTARIRGCGATRPPRRGAAAPNPARRPPGRRGPRPRRPR